MLIISLLIIMVYQSTSQCEARCRARTPPAGALIGQGQLQPRDCSFRGFSSWWGGLGQGVHSSRYFSIQGSYERVPVVQAQGHEAIGGVSDFSFLFSAL